MFKKFKKFLLSLAALAVLSVPVRAQNPVQGYSTGTITASAGSCTLVNSNGCVVLPLPNGNRSSAVFTVSGSFTGTLYFIQTNAGLPFSSSLAVTPVGGGAVVTSTTSPGSWTAQVAGLSVVGIDASISSGSPTVTITSSTAATSTASAVFSNGFPPAGATGLSPHCTSTVNCFTAHGDARWTGDAVTTNGVNTITSATIAATPADTGKHCWVTDMNATDVSNVNTVVITGFCQYVSATQFNVWQDAGFTNPANANFSATGGTKYLLGIGWKDTSQVAAAYAASLQSNSSLNGPPNAFVADCGTYLLDGMTWNTDFNTYKHNVTGSILPIQRGCVTWMISDDFNFSSCVAGYCLMRAANAGQKSTTPDFMGQSFEAVTADMSFLFPGLTWSSQSGIVWFLPAGVMDHVQIANVAGPTGSTSTIVRLSNYASKVTNSHFFLQTLSATNPPTSIDINGSHDNVVRDNFFYGSYGIYVQVDASAYGLELGHSYYDGPFNGTSCMINIASGVLDAKVINNTFSLAGASNTGLCDAATMSNVDHNLFVSQIVGNTDFSCTGMCLAGSNRYYGASKGKTLSVGASALYIQIGTDFGLLTGTAPTNSGTLLPFPRESGSVTCGTGGAGTWSYTFKSTLANGGGYLNNPTVTLSDQTAGNSAFITALSTTAVSGTCTGSDVVGVSVTPNPF